MLPLSCRECGGAFERPRRIREQREGGFEAFTVCPFCGGDYERADECLSCAGAFPESRLRRGFCEACAAKIRRRFVRLMKDEFDESERALLNELWDGEDF